MDVITLLMLLIALAVGLVWVIAFADATRRSPEEFRRIGRSRASWVLLLLLAGAIAGAYYLAVLRPQLASVAHPAPPQHP